MINYITGSTYNQVIQNVVEEVKDIVFTTEIANEIDIAKYIKQNITKLGEIDTLIIDISVCTNTDEEIVTTFEMIRTMYDALKIIVLAAYRADGDEFLTQCFNLGILNIINTNDFLIIREELKMCLVEGKSFKDSIKYKNTKIEKIVVKHETKKAVNKKLVGFAGTETNIGVTHNAIILANYFRKSGFMVALVEMNSSSAFDEISKDFDEKEFDEGYFTLHGVDFYSNCNAEKMIKVMGHSYNFIILDCGSYATCDRVMFERCEERIIVTGSKSWETDKMNAIFASVNKETLIQYTFCFNFTPEKDCKAIKEGMGDIKKVHFLKYTEDPFTSSDFSDADIIFEENLPDKIVEEKKRIFKWKKGR